MHNEPSNPIDTTRDSDLSIEETGEESDRISILQWILMFAALGVVIYFGPVLFKLLPK